jgi:hypothetical protein
MASGHVNRTNRSGARFFFGFRPRLLGINKQWVGTD